MLILNNLDWILLRIEAWYNQYLTKYRFKNYSLLMDKLSKEKDSIRRGLRIGEISYAKMMIGIFMKQLVWT